MNNKCIHMLATLLVSMCLLSCNGYDSPLEGYDFKDLTFSAEQSFQELDFGEQDLGNIRAKADDSWCQAYASDGKVVVVVLENLTYDDRTTKVTVTDVESGDVVVFNVLQKQNNVVIFDAETNTLDAAGNCLVTAPVDGGTYQVKYQTNVTPELLVPSVDWIFSGTRGLREEETSFTVEANSSGERRQAVIKVTDANTGTEGKIIVTQLADTYIRFDDNVLSVGPQGGTFTINVYTNIDIICETVGLQNWVTIGNLNNLGNYHYTQTVTLAALPEGTDSRTCELSFHRYDDLSFYKTLTVLQERY